MGWDPTKMVQPFRTLLGPSLRLLDRFAEIHVRGQLCSPREHQPHFCRHWELALLEGTTQSEFDLGDPFLRVGQRIDQFLRYGDLEGDPDRRWVGSSRRDHGIGLLSCGTEDEKGSESLGLHSTGLYDCRTGVNSTLCPFREILPRIFILDVPYPFSAGAHSAAHRSYHLQLGAEISSSLHGGDYHSRGACGFHDPGVLDPR